MIRGGAVADGYAGVVLDLDGVVYRHERALDGAADTVAELGRRGVGVVFVTNNATRTPREVADKLRAMGVPADPSQVLTSALAAARMIDAPARCLVIGERGVRAALDERGLGLVEDAAGADVVVVGWDRRLTWDQLRRATLALSAGARFVATNSDLVYPSPEGPWPGNGATLAALTAATGREPEVAGKPRAPLLTAAAGRLPEGPLLMVGDSLATDVAGAAALGWDCALVLTGVTAASDVDGARPRPTYVLDDLGALLGEAPG
ncbi:MAG: HAD-IIA family hydrolase [Actinomycetota bacterium]|nr:HAD-IIA family hydrolase [Actinomycetota bacterium]